MNPENFEHYRRKLSELNGLRVRFWKELRELRNDLLSKHTHEDKDFLWLRSLINDMWESGLKEELRRENKILPKRDMSQHRTSMSMGGLYASDRLCDVCSFPLSGRQERYCSETCRQIAKSRRYRKEHPEEKQKANLKYLKDIFHEEK